MKCFVLNGWASSPDAWSLCRFRRDRIFSYVEQLDGLARNALSGCDGAVLVGWSMGGSMALRLMLEFPEKVKGIVLVAATPRMMEERESGWRGMTPRRLDALKRGVELTHGEGFFGVMPGRPNPYMADSDENLDRGLAYLLETDLRADLAAAAPAGIPAAIFQSERDGIVRPENAQFLKGIFPGARLEMVAGAEHALPVSIPELIDEAVERIAENEV
jgi:pimeloyl-[acyl-carrier protein] methyl ester esterase